MKVLVTGDTGFVGTNLMKLNPNFIGWSNGASRIENYSVEDISHLLSHASITHIIHLGAIVGGVQDNAKRQYDFFYDNVKINTLIVEAARLSNCKILAMSSSCCYPEKVPIDSYPMTEEMVHYGPPEPTNYSYGMAKRMMDVQITSARKQYKFQGTSIYSSNLFGPNDKFGSDKSHMIPATIDKIRRGDKEIVLFGDGSTQRQMTYVEDLCSFIKDFIEVNDFSEERINFANPANYSIKEVSAQILKEFGKDDQKIVFNMENSLRGQDRRDVSINRLIQWYKKNNKELKFTSLEDGLKKTHEWLENYKNF